MEPFRHHVFVCTQQKAEGVTSCAASGAFTLLDTLGKVLQKEGLDDDVQVTTCGCMGLCDESPVMVVYPEGTWYRKLQPDDIGEIARTHLKDGKVVERLEWKDAGAMKTLALDHRDKYRAMVKARDQAGTLPDDLNELIRGYMPSRVVLTALELDVFTAVGSGATADAVSEKLKTSLRGTETLLNALASLGLLKKSDGRFECTPASARFFSAGSKDNARPGLLHIANIWHGWSNLTNIVKSGEVTKGARSKEGTEDFIAAMHRNATERARLLVKSLGTDGVRRILDLGGGSGAYSVAFAKAEPSVEAVILDVPEVVGLTKDYVEDAGVANQVKIRPGDMLTSPLDSGYDLVMLNAICHMFSPAQNRALLKRAFGALAPGGRLAIQDFILNPDKASPRHAALFAINMLVGTKEGSTYSEPEYSEWMREAGFTQVERVKLHGPSGLIVGHKG
ncbi:MAG: methyltransferase [Terriglobia bacterium]|nr:methyltransferase [Terriglobia bacterium]